MQNAGGPLSAPAVQQDYKVALSELTAALDSIQTYFETVTESLSIHPSAVTLAQTWQEFNKRYTDCRWKLKENSADLDDFVAKIGSHYLPQIPGYIRRTPHKDIEEALNAFSSETAILGQVCLNYADDFSNLKDELSAFKDSCTSEEGEWGQRVSELKERLVVLHKEREEILVRIRSEEAELEKLQSAQKIFEQPKMIIGHFIEGRFVTLLQNITIFNEIWASGDRDVKELASFVANPDRCSVPLAFALYQNVGQPVYSTIGKALQAFAIGPISPRHSDCRPPSEDGNDGSVSGSVARRSSVTRIGYAEKQTVESTEVTGRQNYGQRNIGQQNFGQQNVGQQSTGQQIVGQQATGQQNTAQQIVRQQSPRQQSFGSQSPRQLSFGQRSLAQQTYARQSSGQQVFAQQTYGRQTYGQQTNGQQTYVQQTNGQQTNGQLTNGQQTNGLQINGQLTNGQLTTGLQINGQLANGLQINGQLTNGQQINGQLINGQQTYGQQTYAQQINGQQDCEDQSCEEQNCEDSGANDQRETAEDPSQPAKRLSGVNRFGNGSMIEL